MANDSTLKTSHTQENYLKALYHLTLEKKEVTVNDLAKRLDLKMPSITSMMQKMANEKLIKYEKYKPIKLTEKGKKEAAIIIRKHRLTEMFLVEKMNFGWEEVHDIAEQIEHIQSQKFFQKMDDMLGHPALDPHGSPIPDKYGNYKQLDQKTLDQADLNTTVVVIGLTNSSDDLLRFLNSKGIKLGSEMVIVEKEPFDGSMKVAVGKKEMMLSSTVSAQLFFQVKK
ncbi:MAG: metal-dependent transcriptional regulator [Chitinophagaceae bacterium]|nr:metal-dependent transcriptional regulator [Chitinophagaceae bacterium]